MTASLSIALGVFIATALVTTDVHACSGAPPPWTQGWALLPHDDQPERPAVLLVLIRGEIPTRERGPLWFTLPVKLPRVITCGQL
jgi:hypothetical protein